MSSNCVNDKATAITSAGKLKKRKYGDKQDIKNKPVLFKNKVRSSQACDRCRLKKIKCDGITPTCSNCAKIDFKCVKSDKLSRRGFPKGYTEMLEKQVVHLQKLLDSNNSNSNNNNNNNNNNNIKTNSFNTTKGNMNNDGKIPFINDTILNHENYLIDDYYYIGTDPLNMLNTNNNVYTVGTMPDQSLFLFQNYYFNILCANDSNLSLIVASQENVGEEQKTLFIPKSFCNLISLAGQQRTSPTDVNTPNNKNNKNSNGGTTLVSDSVLKKIASRIIEDFVDIEMSLIPILYPKKEWKDSLLVTLLDVDNTANNTTNTLNLCCILLIYEWKFKLISINDSNNERILLELIKLVCLQDTKSIKSTQLLLLLTYYSMSLSPPSNYKYELINLCFSKILTQGLYIEPDKFTNSNTNSDYKTTKVVTYWCFQFLDTWFNLTMGKPKCNFTLDEFQMKNLTEISAVLPKSMKSYMLLSRFIVDGFDGLDLKQLGEINGSKPTGANTTLHNVTGILLNFKNVLEKYQLYHSIGEHLIDNNMNSNDVHNTTKEHDTHGMINNSSEKTNHDATAKTKNIRLLETMCTKLDASHIMEIKISLYYLIVKLLVTLYSKGTDADVSIYNLANEILSLYYIILKRDDISVDITVNNESTPAILVIPPHFQILHFLPINNIALVDFCLKILREKSFSDGHDETIFNVWETFWDNKRILETKFKKQTNKDEINSFSAGNNRNTHDITTMNHMNSSIKSFSNFLLLQQYITNGNVIKNNEGNLASPDIFHTADDNSTNDPAKTSMDKQEPKENLTSESIKQFLSSPYATTGVGPNTLSNSVFNNVNFNVFGQFKSNQADIINTTKTSTNNANPVDSTFDNNKRTYRMMSFIQDEDDEGYIEDDEEDDDTNNDSNENPLEIIFPPRKLHANNNSNNEHYNRRHNSNTFPSKKKNTTNLFPTITPIPTTCDKNNIKNKNKNKNKNNHKSTGITMRTDTNNNASSTLPTTNVTTAVQTPPSNVVNESTTPRSFIDLLAVAASGRLNRDDIDNKNGEREKMNKESIILDTNMDNNNNNNTGNSANNDILEQTVDDNSTQNNGATYNSTQNNGTTYNSTQNNGTTYNSNTRPIATTNNNNNKELTLKPTLSIQNLIE